jgi:hypothetical protein
VRRSSILEATLNKMIDEAFDFTRFTLQAAAAA